MRTRLPPMFTLQAFEAAARLGNFSRAAVELHLTPGAVSRQVRQLEDWCAQTLFERHGAGMRLTLEGRELLARLGGPLAALHEAVYGEAQEARPTLQVATLGSTARAWLMPRLGDFAAQWPHTRLTVLTDYALVRPPPRVAMVALRYGLESDGGELLFEDRLVAVATRGLSRRLGRQAERWSAELVLDHVQGDARRWLVAAGQAEAPAGHAFNDAGIAIDAAVAGLGVVVTRLSLALPHLLARRLVLAHPLVLPSLRGNRLLVRDDSAGLPVVRQFTGWVRVQAVKTNADIRAFDPS